MIQLILSLLGLGDKLVHIQSKSEGALASFTKTLNDLKKVSKHIEGHHKKQDEVILAATKVKESLDSINANNLKVIAKLEEFLG